MYLAKLHLLDSYIKDKGASVYQVAKAKVTKLFQVAKAKVAKECYVVWEHQMVKSTSLNYIIAEVKGISVAKAIE